MSCCRKCPCLLQDKTGILLVVSAGKDGALTGGDAFMQVPVAGCPLGTGAHPAAALVALLAGSPPSSDATGGWLGALLCPPAAHLPMKQTWLL